MSHYDDPEETMTLAEVSRRISPAPELRQEITRLQGLNVQLCGDVLDVAHAVDIVAALVSVADRAGIEAIAVELRDAVVRVQHRPVEVTTIRNKYPDAVDLDIVGGRLVPGS